MPSPAPPLPLRPLLLPALGVLGLLLAGYGGLYYLTYQLIPSRTGSFTELLVLNATVYLPALLALGCSLGYLTLRAGSVGYTLCRLGLALLAGLTGAWLLLVAFMVLLDVAALAGGHARESFQLPGLEDLLQWLPLAVLLVLAVGSPWLRRRGLPAPGAPA